MFMGSLICTAAPGLRKYSWLHLGFCIPRTSIQGIVLCFEVRLLKDGWSPNTTDYLGMHMGAYAMDCLYSTTRVWAPHVPLGNRWNRWPRRHDY
ncbi:hypothetical protein PIB30_079127, partial [Stylosanthes scabra]|nr:hypothetical protein [Stylosanthes scabra]